MYDLEKFDQSYWDNRYKENDIPWDIGYPAPAIIDHLAKLDLTEKDILIPGGGNSYEAQWLLENSSASVTVIDLSPTLIEALKQRFNAFGSRIRLIQGDFFDHDASYDIIIEQTFFCALSPHLRTEYVSKMYALLKAKGTLCGLMFNMTFEKNGPPFGGSAEEYQSLFEFHFENIKLHQTSLSIPPRKGNEIFIEINKEK